MRYIPFITCLFLSVSMQAQLTEERTEILDKQRGTAAFVLRAGEHLYSFQPENGWYKVRKKVVVRLQDMEGKLMNPGVTLRNKEGDSIGHTLTEIKAREVKELKKYRGDNLYEAILEGYVFKTKLEDGSVPEEAIEEMLATRNRNEQQQKFKALRALYDFEERKFDDLVAYVYREENRHLDEELDFRLIVVYRGGTTPYALVTNGHTIKVPKSKFYWEESPFAITYFYKPTSAQQEQLQDILYTFMAL